MLSFRASLLVVLSLAAASSPSLAYQRGSRAGGQGAGPAASPAGSFSSLPLRSIGPALTSGRVVAFAVHPTDPAHYYVAAASGGVWKTTNNGATWAPVFENEATYSIGALVLDPKNPNVVWVGTGELNAQRSVGYGDGIYKSEDGGKSWKNLGLKTSEHIARIVISPADTNTVYVAAQGPLWGPGGDRGLFKTTDGGKTWKNVLSISENTGVTDVTLDPRNPNVLYAASWQRRRHVHTYIGGGPESGIHKSTDGGATWTKLRGGLPGGDLGRIGVAISPADPDIIYATVEAGPGGQSGTYVSTDYGASWEKRSDFVAQGMYYGQIIPDPKDPERIYLPSVTTMISEDGGRTVRPLGERNKHVDNHAVWIDPANTKHLLEGCDGGVYESHDRGTTWIYKPNLSITQFYRVALDNAMPFYHIYGGTQDNNSLGGPVRTKSPNGITNDDWYVTLGGDGFHQQVDPKDPDIVYSVLQYGGISRYNRRTGERVSIQPVEGKGEPPLRWNWDSPLLISPHSNTRVYFAANRLFRSDDRGNSWKAISPDLSRQIDRNTLKVMGRVWKLDAVARNQSTSFYGNIVSLTESPVKEGVIYIGTDDGLIQVTEDGGKTWRKEEKFPGVPDGTYVSYLVASRHNANTVYALFDNHKNSDFAPYALKSTDAGRTWTSIAGDLPKNGPALCLAEDHVAPGLLFLGTEFGLFSTTKGGESWTKMRGLPTIPVRDLGIHRRENDLVIATFGRGFYVLDDYSPMRAATPEAIAKEAALLPVEDALAYVEYSRLGFGRGSQGETYFVAPNPAYGATITYYLKEGVKTLKQKRIEAEQAAEKKGEIPPFPTAEQLRAEAEEEAASVILTVSDAQGNVVRRLTAPASAGVHRVTWDLRGAPATVSEGGGGPGGRGGGGGGGFHVMPGQYKVALARRSGGAVKELAGPVTFAVTTESDLELKPEERRALQAYYEKVSRLQRALTGALEVMDTLTARLPLMKRAIQETPKAPLALRDQADAIEKRLREISLTLRGDPLVAAREEPVPTSVVSRVQDLGFGQFSSPRLPTQTRLESYKVAAEEFGPALAKLRALVKTDVPKLERAMDAAGVPHTPGRLPDWREE